MQNHKLIILTVALCSLPLLAGAACVPGQNQLCGDSLSHSMATPPLPVLPTQEANASHVMGFPSPPVQHVAGGRRTNPETTTRKGKRSLTLIQQDHDTPDQKVPMGAVISAPVTVMPEVTTSVQLSSSDLNRIICSDGDIKEALTSDEKGLMIKITGKDAFVKFKVGKMSDGKLSYSATPTEIYMVCGGSTYSLVAFPSRIASQTIKLSSGMENKIRENQALYAGLPFEKRVLRAIKETYTDNLPDSYLVTKMNQVDSSWNGMVIALRRIVDIEGEGMKVKEYHITLKAKHDPFKLSEKMFLRKEFALNPIAVSIDKHTLRAGETSRLFIVEQRAENPMGSGFQLPTLAGEGIAPHVEEQKETAPKFNFKANAAKLGGKQ